MASHELEQAKERLGGILAKARKLELQAKEVLATRPARKLLARTSGPLGRCALRLGVLVLVLAGLYVYARWPTQWPTQEAETVRTVIRRTCGSGDIVDRVAAFVHTSSSTQDDC
ncbi:uncharacterized protein LOC106638380 [Copidosoma floridanum]|uniref:uncharacterized protein LOC106638380 n=1 Tax=Copidosoma floridanum TaxID=29053 RepID=UPI0006C9B564|nr:uncharacterized protein LOC106638380 [Copidosoma floridanum]